MALIVMLFLLYYKFPLKDGTEYSVYEDEAKRRDFDAESRRELEDTNGPRGSTLVLRQPLALHHHHYSDGKQRR